MCEGASKQSPDLKNHTAPGLTLTKTVEAPLYLRLEHYHNSESM